MRSEPYGWLLRMRLRIHPLFWLIILGSLFTGRFIEVMTIFLLVISHELGHVCIARERGWRIEAIELLPFGGVAQVAAPWRTGSREEIEVALAGPLVNFIMVPLAWLCYNIGLWEKGWTDYYIQCNLLLALFNLLPFAPLDGGKCLQAILSRRMPYRYAQERICLIGWMGALLFFTIGILWHFWYGHLFLNLLLIGAFLAFHNHMEQKRLPYQYLQFLVSRRERADLDSLPPHRLSLPPHTPVREALNQLRRECYNLYQVDCPGKPSVWMTETQLLELFFEHRLPHAEIGRLIC